MRRPAEKGPGLMDKSHTFARTYVKPSVRAPIEKIGRPSRNGSKSPKMPNRPIRNFPRRFKDPLKPN
jgi:hypothetical protein